MINMKIPYFDNLQDKLSGSWCASSPFRKVIISAMILQMRVKVKAEVKENFRANQTIKKNWPFGSDLSNVHVIQIFITRIICYSSKNLNITCYTRYIYLHKLVLVIQGKTRNE